ncbi:unnamed protein product [Blumeria hordei]|uniref:Glycoside hydrolase n=1 Tax=Blumeria hordei TaxID=2867405 RepID=A0A383V130_BLUHO|nr:unnamed protein product [Blumeria hordei]
MNDRSFPVEALGASTFVLLFSLACLILSTLLVCLLIKFGERSKYVTFFSVFTVVSTFASIIQQIHFVANWNIIKQGHFEHVMDKMHRHGIAFGGAGETWDLVLFYIQFYCYNAMSLNILFWAISLFNSSWADTFSRLGDRNNKLASASKVFSIIWPGVIIALMQCQMLQHIPILHITVSYITMFTSLTLGSVLLVLILYKYMKTRRLLAECNGRGEWWATIDADDLMYRTSTTDSNSSSVSAKISSKKKSIYDRALVTRFTIGFVVNNNREMAESGEPDLSVSGAIEESFMFIPGVSVSLIAFLVFGTTKSWRRYRDLIFDGCSNHNHKENYRGIGGKDMTNF